MIKELIDKLNINIDSELSLDELKILYNTNHDSILNFKSQRRYRNKYTDLVKIFGSEHVARNPSEINENTICYVGNLIITEKLPTYNLKYVYGDLFYKLNEIHNLENLQYVIDGNVSFNELKSVEGLENLQYIGGDAIFIKLQSSEGLDNLQYIEGDAIFYNLESALGLENLISIGKNAYFFKLISTTALTNLKYIGRFAHFYSITDKEGLSNLKSIFGHEIDNIDKVAFNLKQITENTEIYFGNLIINEILPTNNIKYIIGDLLYLLDKIYNLQNLEFLQGNVEFKNLTSAKGLENLREISGFASFNCIESSEGLSNLITIGGDAHFDSLKEIDNLENLKKINGAGFFKNIKRHKLENIVKQQIYSFEFYNDNSTFGKNIFGIK